MAKHREGRSPFMFFALTIAYAWTLWLPGILAGVDYLILVTIGAFAPLAAAVTLISRRHGWRESWQFIRQVSDFKTKPVYYLLALLIPLAVAAATHYLAPLFNLQVADTLFPETVNPWLLLIPYLIFIMLIGGGQEEFGWRGYAQQPLQERYGVIKASVMIGLVWGVWHLPLWAFPDAQGAYPFVAFVMQTVGVSLVYGLLYNASGQKLIIAILYHGMWNTAPPLFPFLHQVEGEPQTAYWIYAGVTVAAGLIAAFIIRRRRDTQDLKEKLVQQPT